MWLWLSWEARGGQREGFPQSPDTAWSLVWVCSYGDPLPNSPPVAGSGPAPRVLSMAPDCRRLVEAPHGPSRWYPPCLSAALTSAPSCSNRCRQGRRSGSSLARSRGLLSWICTGREHARLAGRAPRPLHPHPPWQAGRGHGPHPVPAVNVGAMAHEQLHHVGLIPQHSDVQGCVVGDRVCAHRCKPCQAAERARRLAQGVSPALLPQLAEAAGQGCQAMLPGVPTCWSAGGGPGFGSQNC